MANPKKTGKTLIEFSCKNGVYSADNMTVKPLGFLVSSALDSNIATKDIYGDGELQLSIISDKGLTGTLEMTAHDETFETDLGFLKAIEQGLARVQVLQNKTIAVGFESYIIVDGVTKTKKVWLLGVNVAPAGESVSQSTDTINEATASYPLTIKGVNLQAKSGETDYVDENGNTIKIFKITSVPSDPGYATFLDSVPTPKEKSEM